MGLVLGVHLVPEGGRRQVKGHAYMGGTLAAQQVVERHRETQGRRGIETLGVDTRRAVHGIVPTVNRGHAVDQEEFLHILKWVAGSG